MGEERSIIASDGHARINDAFNGFIISVQESLNPPPSQSPSITPPPAPELNQPSPEISPPPPQMKPTTRIVASILAVIIIVGIVYLTYTNFAPKPPPRVVTTNATPPTSQFEVSSCRAISSPGAYRLVGNIATSGTGPCISVTSSNVRLDGQGNKIQGAGPFVQIPPFSYGILIANVSNVTVSNMNVSKFSYDILLSNSPGSTVSNVLVLNGTMSGIYLLNTSNDTVEGNQAFGASSQQGGIGLSGGGNNLLKNNVVLNNAYYGLSINSTMNKFVNNTINSNPVDLFCGTNANLRNTNLFSSSSCTVNYYCDFAQCSKTNQPSNLNSIVLSRNINSCGVILSSGDYVMAKNLNLSVYVNTSNPLSNNICISINSPNVRLNCANNTIFNAYYGISSSDSYNTILENCNFYNNTYGIYLANSFGDNVTGGSAGKSRYALYLRNVTSASVSNVNYHSSIYGIYLSNSSAIRFSDAKSTNNTYGVYYGTGSTNSFLGSNITKNKNTDLFCTAQTYNSSFNVFQSNRCGVTDCNWGACTTHVLVPLPVYPVFGCGTISVPGNYSLESNVIQTRGLNCITLNSSDINLNCQDKLIQGEGFGSGIYIANRSSISVNNCFVEDYATGINATNAKFLKINNATVSNSTVGVHLSNSNFSQLLNSRVSTFDGYGVSANNLNNSVIINNTASKGVGQATGFLFARSNKNIITGNNANSNPGYGFVFNNSRSNVVSNNTALSNYDFDYYCAGGSSGIYAESGLVNTGLTKQNCIWMVEQDPATNPVCYAISTSSDITLQQDMLYTFGQTCYTVFDTNATSAQSSIIDCNGHTVLATNGGIFANIKSSSVEIENCYLRGFSKAVISTGQQTSLLNDTIVNSNYSVTLINATYPLVRNTNFTNSSYGIYSQNSKYGTFQFDAFRNVSNGVYLLGGSAFKLFNDTVNVASTGVSLLNSQLNALAGDKLLNASIHGIACTQFATNQSNNMDQGGNACSSNSNCRWMTVSAGCKPS